jgi:TRAP-type C4-dicarboxylate transport system permease small subunit
MCGLGRHRNLSLNTGWGAGMKKILRVLDEKIEVVIMCFFFFLLMICIFLQVFTRFVLNNPLSFTEEVSRFSFVWICYIGIGFSAKLKNHIRIEVFIDKLPKKVAAYIGIAIDLFSILFFVFLLVLSIEFIKFTKIIIAPALAISMIVVNISVGIGFLLAVIRSIQVFIIDLNRLKQMVA